MDAVVEVQGVVKRWGQTLALGGATCTVRPGVTGLLGANGAGKTSLLGLILGLDRPDEGSIRVFGIDPASAGPDVRARLGYSPEHHLMPPDVKAVDFVRHVAEVHGLPRLEATNRASDVLWQVGLGEERGRPLGTMSTGQRQRVKLAQALAHDPTLVLLDEPTDGLDPVQRDAMLELIHRIGHEFGITVLLSSHLLEEVERICDAAIILSGGIVAAAGSLDELRGSSEGIEVEFDGTPEVVERTLATIATSGADIRPNGRGFSITGGDDLTVVVRDAVAANDLGIRRLDRRTISLEQVFLGVGAANDPLLDPRRAGELPPPPPPPPPTAPARRDRLVSAPETFGDADAQILDRGYRSYDGDRSGVRGAMLAVASHSVQRALGMRRSAWAKVLPVATIAFAYLPAIVFVGAAALLPDQSSRDLALPSYGDYYGFVISAIMVFVALVAPEVLCTDRRTGMLGVYLAAPLDRDTYLLAKAAGIAFVLSIVCLGPPLLMLVANTLQSSGPEGIVEILETTGRVLITGVVITLLFTGITMGVTSLTDRKAIAAATIMLLFLVSLSITGSIEASGGPVGINALAPTLLSLEMAQRLHGEYSPIMWGVPDVTLWIAWAGWTIGGFALARNRLHALPVTR